MSKNLSEMRKSDVLNILAKLALDKIQNLEEERQGNAASMNEGNLAHYLTGQDKIIQRWRKFVTDIKKYQNHPSTCVEDGALVKISGYPLAEWVFINQLRSSMRVEGTEVAIDDGQLGRTSGSLHKARVGEKVTLKGDERSNSDLTVQILKIL